MTREEARQVIAKILSGEVAIFPTEDFYRDLERQRYGMPDVRAILRAHTLEHAPEFSVEHRNFKVYLRGKCVTFGRPTCLILGLREDGPNSYVTIFRIAEPRKEIPRRP